MPETPPRISRKRKLWISVGILVVMGAVFGGYAYYRLMWEHREPLIQDPEERFKYGSIGAEHDAGVPYWIFYVLPRMFPEKVPGPNGLASFGVSWEQGRELPIGFTKKVIGIPRVGNNCAACHIANYRTRLDERPTFVTAAPGHTLNLEAFFRFLVDCAKDPRFNADNLMHEIALVTDLDWFDRIAYRFLIIPITRKRLRERETQFAWIYHKEFPEWGRGRDDAMNLTKYFMIKVKMDDSFGPSDIPSIWNLKKYDREGTTMNWSGDSHDSYSVIMDSALGLLGAAPHDKNEFLDQVKWLQDYLRAKAPPRYPFPTDEKIAASGKNVFDQHCAGCHASEKTGTRMPLAMVDTDPERIGTWNKENAIAANKVVRSFGIERKGLVEDSLIGYNPPFLDGIWLRAPYLHNGSVPTLRDLLTPPDKRPKVFWRGYDLYDPVNVGFVSQGPEAERVGTKYDTAERASHNQGHVPGTTLSDQEKNALLEYLKTL